MLIYPVQHRSLIISSVGASTLPPTIILFALSCSLFITSEPLGLDRSHKMPVLLLCVSSLISRPGSNVLLLISPQISNSDLFAPRVDSLEQELWP